MYLHIAQHTLHAYMLGLSEPRIDALKREYARISVCVHEISSCECDKELITHSQTQAFLSGCTIGIAIVYTHCFHHFHFQFATYWTCVNIL